MTGKIHVVHEVKKHIGTDGWELCFQYGLYQYKDGQQEEGYSFV